jgi:hypothetical protein
LRLVLGCDEMVGAWVGEKIGTKIMPPYVAIGATSDGVDLCAGAVFNDYTGSNLEITLAADHGLTRGNIRAAMHYAFVQIGVVRLSAKTKRSNKIVQRMLPRMGFKFEGVSARYFGPNKSDDAMRFVLFSEDARKWL